MTREEVFDILKSKAAKVLDRYDVSTFTEEKTLEELGVDSLAMVEIVAATVRVLKIKVPRPQYAQIKDIRGLLNVFMTHLDQQPQQTHESQL
jgi:acyl carrier protein